jgi:Flp pilus assembly protein TadG
MFGSIRKFAKDRKGAFAMQFALMAIPLTVCTGLAIDGGRAFLARFELASALDAAALAVGSTYNTGADLEAIATKFVNSNFRTDHEDPISLELVPGAETITLKGSVRINTFFMPLVGQPYVTVEAESQVRRGGSNIEVAMALDITGSMNTTRMQGLTDAAKILIDEVVNVQQTPYFSKVAVVPWSAGVSTGTTNVDAGAVAELRGTPKGSNGVSAAAWRKAGATTKTITEAGWRTTAGGKTISDVDWRNGKSVSISKIDKTTGHVYVTTSSKHGYSNGDFVRITGASGSYTFLNNNIYVVADKASKNFNLKSTGGSYVGVPSGNTNSGSSASQRCYDASCHVAVITSSELPIGAGGLLHVTGVSGFPGSASPSINNSDTQTFVVSSVDTGANAILLAEWDGPDLGSFSASGGKASECLVSDCRYRVTTSGNHSFGVSDYISIWGMSESGSGTSAMSDINTTWSVNNPATNVFYLPGKGVDYMDWSSGGSAAACALSSCNVKLTSSVTGLAVGDHLRIDSVAGMTGLNNCSLKSSGACNSGTPKVAWPISAIDGSVYTLLDTGPSISGFSSDYSSGGNAQCTNYGCNRLWVKTSGGSERIYQPASCIVERYGDDAATDANPATSPLGMNYTADGTCDTSNYVTPLTSNTTRLNQAIDDLKTGGSTAGHIGIGWAWYMLSPNFANIWDKEAENQPKSYTAPELAKIAILMTDGEFNFTTCNGVTSTTWDTSQCSVAKDSFAQAEAICTAMKAQDITIYTVGLQIDTSQYSDDFLLKCATSSSHAFLANDNDELKAAFSKIAISISKLRIAK